MKRCLKCQTMLALDAKFCSHCGTACAPAGSPHQVHMQAPMPAPRPAPRGKSVAILAPLAALLLVGGTFGALKGAELLRQKGKAGSAEVLKQEGKAAPASILKQEGEPSGTAIRATASTPPDETMMPADVRAYLEHVRQVELKRSELATDQLAELKTKMTELSIGGGMEAIQKMLESENSGEEPVSPSDDLAADARRMKLEWDKLNTLLVSKTAPPSCGNLASAYSSCIQETGAQIYDILDILGSIGSDPKTAVKRLERMKGDSRSVDRLGKESQSQLVSICQKWNTSPWFEIASDFGGTSFLSSVGFGG